jgi:hypothetical protein
LVSLNNVVIFLVFLCKWMWPILVFGVVGLC